MEVFFFFVIWSQKALQIFAKHSRLYSCLHNDSCYCSTREIKPNQTDIGRKITKKPSAITSSLYSSSNRTTTSGQTSSTTPNSLISNGKRPSDSSERGLSSNDGQQQQQQQQTSSMSHLTSQQQISATSSHSYNTTSSQDHHHDPYQHHNNSALNGVVGDDVDHQRTTSSMVHNLSRNSGQQNHRNPDIMRKPIKWVSLAARRDSILTETFLLSQGKTYTLISIKAI